MQRDFALLSRIHRLQCGITVGDVRPIHDSILCRVSNSCGALFADDETFRGMGEGSTGPLAL